MEKFLKKIAEIKKSVGKLSKDSENPFFHSKYFDINQMLESLEPHLENNKLLLTQPIIDGHVCSIIQDLEEPDNKMKSSLKLPELTDPQKIGSCITYYRRYTLVSLLGLQAEDDDGNKGAGNSSNGESKTQDDAKPWLNPNTSAWIKCEKAIKEDGYTLDDVLGKYKISKENQEKLLGYVK